MLYKNRTIKELDEYYGINEFGKLGEEKLVDCKKIQEAFEIKNIYLTLQECKVIYEVFSDEVYCAGWMSGVEEMNHEELYNLLFPFLVDVLNDRVERIHQLSIQLTSQGLVSLIEL